VILGDFAGFCKPFFDRLCNGSRASPARLWAVAGGVGERVKAPSDFSPFLDSRQPKLTPLKRPFLYAFISLVVAASAPGLRGKPGRNAGDKDDTTRHLSWQSVRVLAFGLKMNCVLMQRQRPIWIRYGNDA